MKYCLIETSRIYILCHGSGLNWEDAQLLLISEIMKDIGYTKDKKLQNFSMFELEVNGAGLGVTFEKNGEVNSYYIVEDRGKTIKNHRRRTKMIDDEMYETCKDCPYYYGEINECMVGEEDIPNDWEKKCEVKND